MSIATIDNQQVHYESIGQGESIIFLHGWIGSWRYWWPTMRAFSKRGRLYAFDFWGFGDSSKEPDKYFFGTYVEQLSHLIEHLGISYPVTLVGHALGAAVALRYAYLWPSRVRRLTLISPPIDGTVINQDLAEMETMEFTERYLFKFLSVKELQYEVQKSDPFAVSSLANQLLGYDFKTDIDKFDGSILVINGDRDQVIDQPLEETSSALRKNRNHHHVTLAACDHFPMLEQPSRFNRLLLDFLRLDHIRKAKPQSFKHRVSQKLPPSSR
ncbi:MAG TPA: alpha/beta hydrolase [candidate division Zixibacteria bacterium]|nr:alpha/beta hydrolase [candidate division Zixibacteria bacterium]